MKTDSLRNVYKLEYDESGIGSGLIVWYNRLIDKTIEELDVVDVSKMMRQNILKTEAVNRAIELFLINPYDGEMQDGDLLASLIAVGFPLLSKADRFQDMVKRVKQLESTYGEFEWANIAAEEAFEQSIIVFEQLTHDEARL
ncbi:MAG: contact-dependent growth inhibition system immunity protein [Coriobacteriia bacterium]|nr:contact-dependent growth inhibition system immunity protein [Coriobacteriia bacterium]